MTPPRSTDENLRSKQIDRLFHKKTAAVYDKRVDAKFNSYHVLFLHPFIDKVKTLTGRSGDIIALDVGCGTGSVSVSLAERGFKVIAVDHSPEMIRMAMVKAINKKVNDRISFVIGDAEDLCFKDASFSFVYCQGVVHYIADKHKMINEIFRVLKQKGRFYISEPVEIFSHFRIIGLLGKMYHFIRGEKDIESPLIKKQLIDLLTGRVSTLDYFLTFYVPYFSFKKYSALRKWSINALKNRMIGMLIFVYGEK